MSKITQQERNGLYELTSEAHVELKKSKYFNDDLAPTTVEQRNWSTSSICNLWIGMSICIPSLSLASSLIGLGVSPLLSVLNVILGNLIVLIPIQLNSQIGTKYGIPFPIFSRMTFGNKGAQLPTVARAIVLACCVTGKVGDIQCHGSPECDVGSQTCHVNEGETAVGFDSGPIIALCESLSNRVAGVMQHVDGPIA